LSVNAENIVVHKIYIMLIGYSTSWPG